MAKYSYLLLLAIGMVVLSCETKVDLLSDEGDVAVVFALLNPDDSVQKIKINKTFVGEQDAAVLAKDTSSFNYGSDVLDVVLEGYNNGNRVQTFIAKRTTNNPKNETGQDGKDGIFSTANNVIYEVANKADGDSINSAFSYQLKISNNLTNEVVSAETPIIDNFSTSFITSPRSNGTLSFANGRNGFQDFNFEWTTIPNAKKYELYMTMYYRETEKAGSGDTSGLKSFEMYIGEETSIGTDGGEKLSILFNGESFFRNLNNEFIDKEPKRWLVETFSLRYVVGGDALNTYISVNQPSDGIVQEKPEYTNVTNGLGIVSSRRQFVFSGYYLNPNSIDELVGGQYTKGSGLTFCHLLRNSSPPSYECN